MSKLLGKYEEGLMFLATAMEVEDKEFKKALESVDIDGVNIGNAVDRIGTQITLNRLKTKLREANNHMGLVWIVFIAAGCWYTF